MDEIIREINTLEEIQDNVRASTPTKIKMIKGELTVEEILDENGEEL